MKVWTRQDRRILEVLNQGKSYYCLPEYIEGKIEEFATYYKNLYKWYVKRAEEIVPKPSYVAYPIWVSVDENMQLQPVEGTVILELEVADDEVVITDQEKWGYVVNFFYLPTDEKDHQKHLSELKRYEIGDESALIMSDKGNYYPMLKRKIEQSWERLFNEQHLSKVMQGTLWEIKQEMIVQIIDGGDKK